MCCPLFLRVTITHDRTSSRIERRPILRFTFVQYVVGLITILLVGGLGIEDQQNVLRGRTDPSP